MTVAAAIAEKNDSDSESGQEKELMSKAIGQKSSLLAKYEYIGSSSGSDSDDDGEQEVVQQSKPVESIV